MASYSTASHSGPHMTTRHLFTAFSQRSGTPTRNGPVLEALSIREVIDRIFSFLSPTVSGLEDAVLQGSRYRAPTEGATLRSAALTCRTFREPALDSLWKTMDTPFPFASPLLSPSPNSNFDFGIFSMPPEAFQRNLSRVRTFIYNVPEANFLGHINVFLAIAAVQPALLPRLRTLIIPDFDSCLSLSSFHFSLISPSISSIDIGGIKSGEGYESFMSALCFRAQNSLKDINCRSDQLPAAVFALPHLQSLCLEKLAPNIEPLVKRLASLSDLRSVDLKLAAFQLDAHDVTFPRLEDIRLSGTFPWITHFLRSCQTPYLQSLSLFFDPFSLEPRRCYGGDLTDIFSAMRMHPAWRHTLTTLRVSPIICPDYAQFFRSLADFPLTTLHATSHVTLPPSIRLSLTDIARHLPNIEILHIPPYRRGEEPPFSQLIELARLRPNLRELGTAVKSRVFGSPKSINHNLESLYVYGSSIGDPWAVSEQLDGIFPYLKHVKPSSGSEYERDWVQVESLLKFCQRARRR
ncbi:hypothetical protein BDN72DRAFT_956754 [Pluteus cervinus]|uniref:Uncharacterized protein n=1 Tax=Pluteus cervinus TaxID=181527 RepID=A0ACD3B686_9AGAR|nr:hypothetical protein BDN72DRAFT_956754 [Pluteus cervinus]